MMLYMRWLPPANYKAGYAYGYEHIFTVAGPGAYWCLCAYPGHAEGGMHGEMIAAGGVTAQAPAYLVGQYPVPYRGPGWMAAEYPNDAEGGYLSIMLLILSHKI